MIKVYRLILHALSLVAIILTIKVDFLFIFVLGMIAVGHIILDRELELELEIAEEKNQEMVENAPLQIKIAHLEDGEALEKIIELTRKVAQASSASEEKICEREVCEREVCEREVCEREVCQPEVCEREVCEREVCEKIFKILFRKRGRTEHGDERLEDRLSGKSFQKKNLKNYLSSQYPNI